MISLSASFVLVEIQKDVHLAKNWFEYFVGTLEYFNFVEK